MLTKKQISLTRKTETPLLKLKVAIQLILIIIMAILLLGKSSPVSATTPVDYVNSKPSEFVIWLPWRSSSGIYIGSAGSYDEGLHKNKEYYALDFMLPLNENIYAVAAGTVLFAGPTSGNSDPYGNVVMIDHVVGGTHYQSFYAHLSSLNVQTGQTISSLDQPIGKVGKSSSNPTNPVHLHFALFRGASFSNDGHINTINAVSIVPEPFVGVEVYEGFGLKKLLNPKWRGPLIASNPGASADISVVTWSSNASQDGSTIGKGQTISLSVDGLPSNVKEVRLTAYYPNWSNGLPSGWNEKVWRILARCWPNKTKPNCSWSSSNTKLSYLWNPYTDSLQFDGDWWSSGSSFVNPAYNNSTQNQVCISFDVFDQAGNVAYSPAGTQCSSQPQSLDTLTKYSLASSQGSNSTRLIYVLPSSSPPVCQSCTDEAQFIADITIPDGSVLSLGQALTKTWRVKNIGTSTWNGYKLKFTDGEQMGGPAEIIIPTTAPGQTIDITANLVGPSNSGSHSGSWQIVNSQGGWVSGGKLWVKINVGSQSGVIALTTDPLSPSNTSMVRIHAFVNTFPNFRALRIKIDGSVQYEIGALDAYWNWNTSGYSSGEHSIVVEVADQADTSWSHPQVSSLLYTLTGTGVSNNHAPNQPVLKSPYDWYLKDSAGASTSVELCANPASDPEGSPVQYWFEVKDQGGGVYASSGWNSSACWTRTYSPNTYSWRVKTGDGSAESDWSVDTWHFSVAGGGVYIGNSSLFDLNTDNTHLCVFVTYDGIQGPDVRAWINEAADGSENGEWRLLDHYGPNTTPDCTQSNYHGFWIRSTRYETGNHALRISAFKPDSGNSATKMTNYNIAYIRPPTPELIVPSSNTNNGTWWNTRSIHFAWNQTLRTDNYTLRVSTNANPWADPSPILNQVLGSGVTSYDYTFSQDYAQLYWSVKSSNSAGLTDSGSSIWYGIDLVKPACQIQALPSTTYANVFQVNWNSTDNSAGIRSADIQFMDSERGTWEDWLTSIPFNKTYDLFDGQPGHSYFFRCRATDNANNTGNYPASANTSITIDPFTRPGTPWWNTAYGQKRNLVILNNMGSTPLPQSYPIHLHFDNSTTPTAATLYAESLASTKCNDLRIIYSDAIELDRVVQQCTSSAIDIWFRSQVSITSGSSNNTAHQLYYGNPSASNPPTDRNNIFYPQLDSNYLRVFDMREGTGNALSDSTGNGSATMGSELSWTTSGKFGPAVLIPGDLTSEPRYAINAGNGPQPTCDFSAELWLKRLAGHQYGGQLVQQEIGGPNPWRWMFTLDGDRLRLAKEGASGAVLSDGSLGASTYFNNWHHIAVTYNCSGQVRFYIDGQLDSIKNFNVGGLNPASAPLRIGNNAYNNNRLAGYISGVALSNVVRSDFFYGTFAAITNEPTTATDSVVTPPITGSPDLNILSLSTYPNPEGGVLIEAIIENQGDLSTQSGFYTDLYLDHLPTGAEDYSNSLRFWINDPIGAGENVILTTVITDLSSLSASAMLKSSNVLAASTLTETSGTLYAQTDSAGLVEEPDNQNNIFSPGVQICTTGADTFEDDDAYTTASQILIGNSQTHNFDLPGNQDWIKFVAQAGTTYHFTTSSLGIFADTYLYLYDTNGTTLISSNDDFNDTLASQIEWTAPQNGTYYILVKTWNPNTSGCGTQYKLTVTVASATTAPTVSSIVRASASPTAATSVDFTVTFSESVTGVNSGEFTLNTTGVTGASIKNVSGSNSIYTVTVNTGSGDGTIRLDIPVSASITDTIGNSLANLPYTSGQTYAISKAATVATFSDVPLTYWASSYIERLFNAGITGGCGAGIYCPDNSVTRAQMAVFLLKGIHGSSYVPPAVNGNTSFSDVAADYWAAAWIKQLAAEGITSGCGAGIYCPDNTVTRAQMAVFLLKAKNGSNYSPPAVGVSTGFNDVATDYWAAPFIKQLVTDGITSGCGAGNYCPDAEVTRAQMAVFLVKAFGLP